MLLQEMKKIYRVCVFLLIYTFSTICLAATIETQLSSNQVMLGDTVYVTYLANNSNMNGSPNFAALQKDFRVVDTNYGTAVNMINGVTTTQSYWRLQLQPKHAGEIVIPEIQFGNDKSSAQKLMVSAGAVTQTIQKSLVNTNHDAPVFVRGEINTNSPYVQSFILYTFKLYFRAQIREPRVALPQAPDATFLQLADVPAYQTKINDRIYNVVEKTFAIFPKKPGPLLISPMQFQGMVLDDNNSPYDDPFNYDIPKPVQVETKEFHLTVRDVPANYQGNAWLPARNITISEQWSDNISKRLDSGTPITRTIKITAQGLRADQIPDLNFANINGVNVYADRPKRDNDISKDMVTGTYEQKVTYIPSNTAAFTTPAIKINWWNTETNANAVSQLNEQTLQVNASSIAPTPAQPAPSTTAQLTTPATTPFYLTIWFWIAAVLFTAWVVTLWVFLRKKPVTARVITTHDKPVTNSDISEKSFKQACKNGEALQAQQYLLQWAKTHWPTEPHTLTSLREIIKDENFARELQILEQSLYASKHTSWSGEPLFTAFQRIKKSPRSQRETTKRNTDPLPPLFPGN